MPKPLLVIVALTVGVTASIATAHQASGVRFTFDPTAILGVAQTTPDDAATEIDPTAATAAETIDSARIIEPFGLKSTWRWTIQGGYGQDIENDGTDLVLLGAGLTYFFFDGLSINAESNGMGFFQDDGDDAGGFNFNLLLRWHFIRQEKWSLYLDAGAGLLVTVNDVPVNGSSFNFTPQAGVGATFAINETLRLMAGVRWLHVSNAGLYDANPGLDTVMGYVGISVPF